MGAELSREATRKDAQTLEPVAATADTAIPSAPVPLPAQAPAPMTVGHAHDGAEHDADRMADDALARLGPVGGEGEQHSGSGRGGGVEVQRSATPSAAAVVGVAGGPLDMGTSAKIDGMRGSGRPLPTPVRDRMEKAFGASFSAVRIHDDHRAAALNDAVSARAFTTGKDIFFARDQFAPGSAAGERVLAHELAHTLQGSGGEVQRWWPFKKDDAATANAKLAMKDHNARAKARKKAEDQANKEAVTAAKLTEKNEDTTLKSERTTGVRMRGVLEDRIDQETSASKSIGQEEIEQTGQVTTKQGSKALETVHRLFARALEIEAATVASMVEKGTDPEEAVDAAYKAVWLDQTWLPKPSGPLRAVRPPRETASERLGSQIRAMRNSEAADAVTAKGAEEAVGRGMLLEPEVEAVYDRFEAAVRTGLASKLSAEDADKKAEELVWARADKKLIALRPKDPRIEKAARQAARDRFKAPLKPAPMEDIDAADRGLSLAGAATPIVSIISGAAQSGLKAAGSATDAVLAKDQGRTDPVSHSDLTKAPILGGVVSASETAKYSHEHGIRDPGALKATNVSIDTQAANGLGAATGVLNDVLSGAKAMVKAIKAIGAANEETTTENVLAATKASADTSATLAALGRDAAKLAAVIDGGVAGAVAKVLPGFSIATSVSSMISGLLNVRTMGDQQSKANEGLFKLRVDPRNAGKVDVLVRPILLMVSHLDKKYERAVWDLIQAVSDTVLNITTLATGGGFGIPAAIQAGTKALDMLHSAGHMIDDNLRALAAQSARTDSVGALEGAAEGQLRKDPAFAMDAIIVQAKTKKDPVALTFLSTYGISPGEAEKLPLSALRERALFEMGVGADPLTTFQTIKKIGGDVAGGVAGAVKGAAVGVKDSVVATVDQYGSSKELGADRTEMDGKERDWKWRLAMAFKSKESYQRSVAQTAIKTGPKIGKAPAGPAVATLCKVGDKVLFATATEKQQTAFADTIKTMPLPELIKAGNDPKNSELWRAIIKDMVSSRVKEMAKKLPPAPPPPAPKKLAPPLPPRPVKAAASPASA
ncbi:MAG: DUF4157 domain-containing protein [Actinomycetota bacterium]|nr:DUF4157 domain-containing protein [Actinomycetota bacterium]